MPDGELVATDPEGHEREDFYVENLYVFSATSLVLHATRAGILARQVGRLHESSGKHTLFGFFE